MLDMIYDDKQGMNLKMEISSEVLQVRNCKSAIVMSMITCGKCGEFLGEDKVLYVIGHKIHMETQYPDFVENHKCKEAAKK